MHLLFIISATVEQTALSRRGLLKGHGRRSQAAAREKKIKKAEGCSDLRKRSVSSWQGALTCVSYLFIHSFAPLIYARSCDSTGEGQNNSPYADPG